jgi:hypothetical protein
VLAALDAPDPEPRYIAGEEGKQMLAMATALSDRDLDQVFAEMFSA